MTKRRKKVRAVARGISSRSPTETEAIAALVTLASYLSACAASSIELEIGENGGKVKCSVTYGSVNSLSVFAPITT